MKNNTIIKYHVIIEYNLMYYSVILSCEVFSTFLVLIIVLQPLQQLWHVTLIYHSTPAKHAETWTFVSKVQKQHLKKSFLDEKKGKFCFKSKKKEMTFFGANFTTDAFFANPRVANVYFRNWTSGRMAQNKYVRAWGEE